MAEPLRVLLLEDIEDDAFLLLGELKRGGIHFVHERICTREALIEALDNRAWDIVLSDYAMPRLTGLDALVLVRERSEDLPFILVSGAIGEERAAEVMRAGATDYVMKDRLTRLAPAIRRSLADAKIRRERRMAIEGLRRAHDELERRVEERTAELRLEIEARKKAQDERDRMTAELLQGKKLQAIGQLAAGIAHEINNPTAYILSNLGTVADYLSQLGQFIDAARESLRRAAAGEDPAAVAAELEDLEKKLDVDFLRKDFAEALTSCREGADRIQNIVKNLKDFAHPATGNRVTTDLKELVESALTLCWNEIKYKAVVRRDYAPVPPVSCLPRQIEQVLVNLVVNAAQSIAEKGEIAVWLATEDGWAVIGIKDTGVGIAPENLDRLFEPFFTTKPVGKGMGLGLHWAHRIVTAHGGKITVASQPGRGTEFKILLPLEGVPAARDQETK